MGKYGAQACNPRYINEHDSHNPIRSFDAGTGFSAAVERKADNEADNEVQPLHADNTYQNKHFFLNILEENSLVWLNG